MHFWPRRPKTVEEMIRGFHRVEQCFDNVRIRSLFGWGGFIFLLVTGTPKKFFDKKVDQV